ncbi:MAG: hypothetical protein VX726_02940 [Planctomycetota bacterium]|nr:hypothetical protein [Planctomycetota bacterium]
MTPWGLQMKHSIAGTTLILFAGSVLGLLGPGCEEVDDPPVAADPADEGGAQSAYGKAQERAERLEEEINAYQEEVIRQADSVFDSQAPRRVDE